MKGFTTRAVCIGQEPDNNTGAIVPPLYLASTYDQNVPKKIEFFYSRGENPTRLALERTIAALEESKHALVFSSGQAAGAAVLSLLKPGDSILSVSDIYGGTYNLFKLISESSDIHVEYTDFEDFSCLDDMTNDGITLVWVETPTNPLMKVIDIERVARWALKRNALFVVDNTFCTAYIQRPLSLGADIVVYSTTKYYSGHMDVIGGAVCTNNTMIDKKLKSIQTTVGAVPGAVDCYLISRGIKTLGLRLDRQVANAKAIARYLQNNSSVLRVLYPGSDDDPYREVASRQMRLSGAMLSFYYKGDPLKLMKRTRIFSCAVSLGGVRSLIECPALMTHRPIPESERIKHGITNSLIRLSIGIEDIDDLLEDLQQALQ